jgi:hypothetical protein
MPNTKQTHCSIATIVASGALFCLLAPFDLSFRPGLDAIVLSLYQALRSFCLTSLHTIRLQIQFVFYVSMEGRLSRGP